MKYKLFSIPTFDNEKILEEMNNFIGNHRIIDIEKQLVNTRTSQYWSFCVQYVSESSANYPFVKKEKVDYQKVLDEKTYSVFMQLRVFRKQISESDSVPAYPVFTDEELANISQLSNITEANMLTVKGINQKKVEKYGAALISLYKPSKP